MLKLFLGKYLLKQESEKLLSHTSLSKLSKLTVFKNITQKNIKVNFVTPNLKCKVTNKLFSSNHIKHSFYSSFKKSFARANSREQSDNSHPRKSTNEIFIEEEDNVDNNEVFPIKQKIEDLIAENEEFLEYKRILNTAKSLINDFDLDKFKIVVTYITDNQVTDSFLYKEFESIFVKNLNQIDYITKATCVVMLGDAVHKKKLSFEEENWLTILKDFQVLLPYMSFTEYYNYIVTFDRLFVKKMVQMQGGKYNREFENFISFQNMNLFNSGKVNLSKIDDVFLFSKLTHSQILKMGNINENIWTNLNRIIQANASELTIYETLIITSLIISFQEVSGKAHVFLADAITEINAYISSLLLNFDLLDFEEQENLINYADNIFNYYVMFIFPREYPSKDPTNYTYTNPYSAPSAANSPILSILIQIYTDKLKSKDSDFMIFKEYRILQLLAKLVDYKDPDFWSLAADKTLDYMSKDFIKIFNDIFPKRLLKNSAMTEEDKIRLQEKSDIQILIYVSMIVETFSSAEYANLEFWNSLFLKVDHFAHFKNKDILVILNFITLGCKKLYKKEMFKEVWEMFTDLLDPKLRGIFRNREIVDFLIKVYSNNKFDTESNISRTSTEGKKDNQSINLDELNRCLNLLFFQPEENNRSHSSTLSTTSETSHVKMFSFFFSIIENKIKNNNKVRVFLI